LNFYVKMVQWTTILKMNIILPCLQFQIIRHTEDLRIPLNFINHGFKPTRTGR
jgi:hypothetical protein